MASTPPADPPGPPHTPSDPRRSSQTTLLIGRHGVRAGWRFVIFLGILLALIAVFALGLRIPLPGPSVPPPRPAVSPEAVGVQDLAIFVLVCLASSAMAGIERRTFADYGFPWRRPFTTEFWEGLVCGFVAISSALLGIFVMHGYRITGIMTRGPALAFSALEWSLIFLLVGLTEDFTFRGYAQFTLTDAIGFWPAAFVLSGLFACIHFSNPGETKIGLAGVGVYGLFACLALRRTGNLWWPIGFHAAWDWGQTFFYGVPDSGVAANGSFLASRLHGPPWLSGGTAGPEASVFAPAALLLAAVFIILRYPRAQYPDPLASARD
jgi:uncharacterized protein